MGILGVGPIIDHSNQEIWGKYTIPKGNLPKKLVHPEMANKLFEELGFTTPEAKEKLLSEVGQLEQFNAELFFKDQAEEQQKMLEEASVQRTKNMNDFAEKGYRVYPFQNGNIQTYCMEIYGYNIGVDLGPQGNKLSEAALLGIRAKAMQIGRPWEYPDNIKPYSS